MTLKKRLKIHHKNNEKLTAKKTLKSTPKPLNSPRTPH